MIAFPLKKSRRKNVVFPGRKRSLPRLGKPTISIDVWLLASILFLALFGLLMIYEASAANAYRTFGDRFHFIREQGQWFVVGLCSMTFMSFFPYKKLYALAVPMLLVTIVLLVAVFLPGIGINALGAHRWINLGFFSFQPAELTKLVLIIYLSAWFSQPERRRLGSFLLLIGTVLGLVILEPDLGTAILIMSIAVILYFLSGAPMKHALLLIPIGIGGILLLAISAPYRLRRLMTFINPEQDTSGSSYHINQVLISLGSGGIFGVGLGASLQKYEYVPEVTTDSIFAIIGEELGFIGAIVLMTVFCFFLTRGYRVASRVPDRFGRLLGVGIVSWVGVQAAINLSTMVALLPLTGVPLPFISYGGSSLIVLMTGMGILLNISKSSKSK